MKPNPYAAPASAAAEELIATIFALGSVGYVALRGDREVVMRTAPGLRTRTSAETNFYEELLVNPTLLGLARRRGEIDCGGLDYIAIGYGDFVQLVVPLKDGHLSMGVSRKAPLAELAARARSILEAHGLLRTPPEEGPLA